MATLIDVEENPEVKEVLTEGDDDNLELATENSQVEQEEEIPEKYRGKSPQELIRMHQEAEKLTGRQGAEVGELRKLVDEFIRTQTVEKAAPQEAEDDVDIFTDPDAFVERKLKSSPEFKELQAHKELTKRQASFAELERKHPDYKDVVQDAGFAKWISESKVRTKLFVEADQMYDVDAADELISSYKERKSIASATVDAEKMARKRELKQASTGGARGSGVTQGKKVYRRADIMNLMTKDPERYALMADEILQAYAEKRVV